MIKRQAGFTMVELLITMTIFVLTIAAASSIFVPMLTQFKQQSKIAETQIEGLVGLETLRRDIDQAGYGLPWVIPASVTAATYREASSGLCNDAPDPPRAIVSSNNFDGPNGSDYLVIKATSIAANDAAMRWTYVVATGAGGKTVQNWGPSENLEDLIDGYKAIVLIPTRGENNQRILVTNGANYSVTFNKANFDDNYTPATQNDLYLIYGVDPDTDLRMPFNRADYYIRRDASTPARCAKGVVNTNNTGVLVKSLINQADPGDRGPGMPLLDCVADMQVIYRLDTAGSGDIDSETDDLNALTAQQIREQLKEVRVYILAHEGQKDSTFSYCVNPPSCNITTIAVGEFGLENNYNLALIADWQRYRWKIYRIVVKPNNLG